MNKSTLEKKKLQAQNKLVKDWEKRFKAIRKRSEDTLSQFPDSWIAMENKKDCEAAFRAQKTIYTKAQLDATKLPRGQATFEEGE